MPNLPMTRPSLPRPVRLRTTRATAEPEAERAVPREEIAAAGLRWISIERPTQADGEWLQATFDFHALDMEDVFSRNQRKTVSRPGMSSALQTVRSDLPQANSAQMCAASSGV